MKNLALKLLAFQKEIGAIPKDSENPFFKSKYADINTYIEVVKPILSKHGLVLLQPLSCIDNKTALLTILVDSESGEKLDLLTALPENPDPQKMGAIITYFRRYAIQSMLCLQAEDDDGNSTVPVKTAPRPLHKPTGMSEQPTEAEIAEYFAAPFDNSPADNLCETCGSAMVPGRNGKPYCKPCYIKWANENKKS